MFCTEVVMVKNSNREKRRRRRRERDKWGEGRWRNSDKEL